MLAAIMFTDMIGYAVYKYKGEEIQIRCLTILIKALKQKKVI